MFNIATFLATLTSKPGVYQMYDAQREVLYVGKAKNLRKRVGSYFRRALDPKTQALMEQVADIEVIITPNENDALLLENNLIKTLKPKYNIIFKDDKSYLYLLLTDHEYPAIMVHRGPKTVKGKYFGPYPKGKVVYETLNLLQKLFQLRVCNDQACAGRSRPCLQYQIRRCSGPCVGMVERQQYQQHAKFAELFLQGENNLVINEMVRLMEESARNLHFEKASFYRDQIRNLRSISEQQFMIKDKGELDVIVLVFDDGRYAINWLSVRHGHVVGSRNYFPQLPKMLEVAVDDSKKNNRDGEIIADFITQNYLSRDGGQGIDLPKQIIISSNTGLQSKHEGKKLMLANHGWIEKTISQSAGKKIVITSNVKKDRAQLVRLAAENALNALRSRCKYGVDLSAKFSALQELLSVVQLPQTIEGFDVSHLGGEATVVACVVFGAGGPLKAQYRKYNIKTAAAADDYAALGEALRRRYKDVDQLPDMILLDGGKGQLNVAEELLGQLSQKSKRPTILLAIAKGEGRRPGKEKIFCAGRSSPLELDNHSPAFHLLQQIRDEAHRFAISGQRNRFAKVKKTSVLESIPGIGPARRKNLLLHFGGIQGLEQAKASEIAKVPGISLELATKICEFLHNK